MRTTQRAPAHNTIPTTVQLNRYQQLMNPKIKAFAGLLLAAYQPAYAADDYSAHLARALEVANTAISHGEARHPHLSAEHAEEAIKHAKAAYKHNPNPHLEEAMTHLKAAIEHSKMRHSDVAAEHAKQAVMHLKAAQQ